MLFKLKYVIKLKIFLPIIFILFISANFYFSQEAKGYATKTNFPKLANFYQKWDITDKEADQLAKYDLIILDMDNQTYSLSNIKKIKNKNPDAIILAYINAQEVIKNWQDYDQNSLHYKIPGQIPENWYLKNSSGQKISWWPTNQIINITYDAPIFQGKNWPEFLSSFITANILNNNVWDGILLDNVWEELAWLNQGDIDLNNDGKKEEKTYLNIKWQEAMQSLLEQIKKKNPDKIINSIGGTNQLTNLNGIFIEHFPDSKYGDWEESMEQYHKSETDSFLFPSLTIINSNTGNNSSQQTDYQKMRFGLTSTLLFDGYYSYDFGDQCHGQTWWYDEYDYNLGNSINEAYDVYNKNKLKNNFYHGVWRRDFERGIVLVNSDSKTRYISLEKYYQKIKGTQDTETNNGETTKYISLAPNDGIILLNISEELLSGIWQNNTYLTLLDKNFKEVKPKFYYANNQYEDKAIIYLNKKTKRNIESFDNKLTIIYPNKKNKSLIPYPWEKFNFDAIDFNDNNKEIIVTAPQKNREPLIKVFRHDGTVVHTGFYAYDKNFKGGVDVAICNLNDNVYKEIVTAAGVGGGPHIRMFNVERRLINPGFYAYDKNFRGGVGITCFDINNDRHAEIITTALDSSQPIRVFSENGKLLKEYTLTKKGKTIDLGHGKFTPDGNEMLIISQTF